MRPALTDGNWDGFLEMMKILCTVIIDKVPEQNASDIHAFCQLFVAKPTNETLEMGKISRVSKHVLTVLYCAVITFALVGNIGVIVVFAKNKSFRGAVTIPILSLAISDLLVTTCCMPFNLVNVLWAGGWDLGAASQLACKMVPYMQTTAVVANALTLGCIAFERYMAVLHPLKSRSHQSTPRTLVILASIWVMAVLFSIPNLIWYQLVKVSEYTVPGELGEVLLSAGRAYCRGSPTAQLHLGYYRFVILVGVFGLSFIGIAVAYFQISHHLRMRKSPGDSTCAMELKHVRTSRRVITMLVVVQLLFFACWTPYLLLEALEPVLGLDATEVLVSTKLYLQWLAASNSCHNPLVYTFLNEKFRKSFGSTCYCCFRPRVKVAPEDAGTSSSSQGQKESENNMGPSGLNT